ncbi:MAG TPA: LacI family DNA-binding transcriptional regulator [Acidobacteriaceae bacterium]|nr:LacI family DNA-binding transcriptional regulator [Acidobacteriaceae bacterium]
MATRLKDIADDLGLSVVTVSKVLRDHPDIGEETRKRVLKRMRELNYQPNFAARSLVTGQTWTLGLVVPDLLHPFFAEIAKAISDVSRKHGYCLLISSSNEDPELEIQEINQLLARRVDVILVASAQSSVNCFRMIEEQKTPYILIDRRFADLEANFVGVDDEAIGMLATSHLLEQQCRRIAHIRGPNVSTANGRFRGYKRALASHKLTPLRGHVVSLGTSGDHRGEKGGYEATREILASEKPPDGIFCFNDPSALGAMRAILDAGLRIPEDVAVVGSGNLSYADLLRVPLSSIDQGSESIGKYAAELALKITRKKVQIKPKTHFISPRLIVRASSRRFPENSTS